MEKNEDFIYLKTMIKPILSKLFEEIGKRRPDDLVAFSIEYLKMAEQSKALKASPFNQEYK